MCNVPKPNALLDNLNLFHLSIRSDLRPAFTTYLSDRGIELEGSVHVAWIGCDQYGFT